MSQLKFVTQYKKFIKNVEIETINIFPSLVQWIERVATDDKIWVRVLYEGQSYRYSSVGRAILLYGISQWFKSIYRYLLI